MGVACIYTEKENCKVFIDQLSETQWIQKDGSVIINLKIILKSKGELDKIIIVLPYKITNIKDTSDDWLRFSNVSYYSKTSGDYYKIIDETKRIIEDEEGFIKVNKIKKISIIENTLPKEKFIKKRFFSEIVIQFLFPINSEKRNLIQMEYKVKNFAFKRAGVYFLGSNWYFVNRYYSLYDLWDSINKNSYLIKIENKFIPVKRIDNWIALPGFSRSASFHPIPKLQSIVTIRHPGYLDKILNIKAQIIARFTFILSQNKHLWYCKEVYVEYESQPLPYWIQIFVFWISLLAVILSIISVILALAK